MSEHELECEHCEAEFQIQHGMDSDRYKISVCPFCGADLDEDVFDAIGYAEDIDDVANRSDD